MASLDRIRTQGFKRWYERQLIECHAWLVTCFLGIVGSASGIEIAALRSPGARFTGIALILAGMATSLISWRRYRTMLAVAERLGERANCPACGCYARFRIIESGPTPMPDSGDPEIDTHDTKVWLRAQCRKCDRQWLL